MQVTIILSIILMLGLFLMLIAGVAFIQDKKYFTSAPKDIQEAILPREERFPGAHALGWGLMILSLILMFGSLIYAAANGIQNHFSFTEFFGRFLIMFLSLKVFDILFFDYFLLCHSNFYPHFYPETKPYVGPHQFGFNAKSHIIMIILCPVVSLVLSLLCMVLVNI